MNKMNNLINLSKPIMLIPLIVLFLNSCGNRSKETFVVKYKICGNLYLSPVKDTTFVCHCINWPKGLVGYNEIFDNIHEGDKIALKNPKKELVLDAATFSSKTGYMDYEDRHVNYAIYSINGTKIRDFMKELETLKQMKNSNDIKKLNQRLSYELQEREKFRQQQEYYRRIRLNKKAQKQK